MVFKELILATATTEAGCGETAGRGLNGHWPMASTMPWKQLESPREVCDGDKRKDDGARGQ